MSLNVKAYPLKKDNCDEEGMQHNLHKSYVMQIMYKNIMKKCQLIHVQKK